MGFYEKDGRRIPEEQAFEYALEEVQNWGVLMEDAFLDWFFRWEQGWHHYPDGDEMESVDEITQQHIQSETNFLRRYSRC